MGLVNSNALPPNPPSFYQYALNWIEDYPLTGSNIAYQTHIYDPISTIDVYTNYDDQYGSSNVTIAQIQLGFEYSWVQYVTQTLGKCLVIGEIGCLGGSYAANGDTVYSVTEYQTFANYLTVLNSLDIGYCGFAFRVSSPYALISSDYPSYTATQSGTILQQKIAAYN